VYERELQVAIDAATKAGKAIAEIYERNDTSHTEKADDKGPLTEADLASDRILHETILAAFPDDAILSEETKDTPARLEKRRCWIIDPLDGTREFTLHLPEFVVSIGFVVDGEIEAGVLYNPATGELFTGLVSAGVATYRGEPCRVSGQSAFEGARFLVSRSEYKKGWFDKYKDQVELTPMGSVAYKFGLVAAGKAEASFTPEPRNEWDLAGGVACVLAAGGRTTDGSNTPYRFNRPDPLHIGVCGTNGHLHERVMAMMKR
jgi:myo-inositol-1(or 4)-monophosphatase